MVKAMPFSAVKADGWHGKPKSNLTVKGANTSRGFLSGKRAEEANQAPPCVAFS